MALIQTGQVSLTKWLSYVPCKGKYAQSKQRRLHRWLNNPRINVHRLYKPLIAAALTDWEESCLHLSLDTSLFWQFSTADARIKLLRLYPSFED